MANQGRLKCIYCIMEITIKGMAMRKHSLDRSNRYYLLH